MSNSDKGPTPTLDDVLRAMEGATLAGPVASGAIEAAERALGVAFPSDYRAFLHAAGAVLGRGYEIAGITPSGDDDEPPLWTDVVSWNQQLRSWQKAPIPAAYIAIATDDGDYSFYIDTTRRDDKGRSPVVLLGPGSDFEIVASDFFEFVIQEINAARDRRM